MARKISLDLNIEMKEIQKTIDEKVIAVVKWILRELFIGIIVGIAVVCATSYMNEITRKEKLRDSLQTIYIGESYEYINSLFGIPIVEETQDTMKESFYKLDNAVLRCVYDNDSLVAFFITVNDDDLYRVTSNVENIKDKKLLEFTYYDFSPGVYDFVANVPANNDDYAYYREIHYGAGPENYNYYVIGNYKDYRKDSEWGELLLWSEEEQLKESEQIDWGELQEYREKITPNTFGIIKLGYEDLIDIVSDSDNVRNYGTILYDGWYQK